MESWRLTWRKGFVPVLPTEGLRRLLKLLREDSPLLLQGCTTKPPPLMCVADWACEGADAIGIAATENFEDATVGEVEESFARCCFEADQRLGEPAGCRWFINFYDDCPRGELLRELIAEVELALKGRGDGLVELEPALTAALAEKPEDRTLRLAVADWYREHGDDTTADALVRQVEAETKELT